MYGYTYTSMHIGFSPGSWLFYNLRRFYGFPSVEDKNWAKGIAFDDRQAEGLLCNLVVGSCPWVLLLEKWQVFDKVSEWLEEKNESWRSCPPSEQAAETKTFIQIPGCLTMWSLLSLSFVSWLFSECCWFGAGNKNLSRFGCVFYFTYILSLRTESRKNIYFQALHVILFLQGLWTC